MVIGPIHAQMLYGKSPVAIGVDRGYLILGVVPWDDTMDET